MIFYRRLRFGRCQFYFVKEVKTKCEEYWRQADFWANARGFGPVKKIIDQLHVKKYAKETTICYKVEDILSNGWCKTSGLNTGGRTGWGVCSESCKFLKNKGYKELSSEDFNKVCTYSMPINFFNVVSIPISLSSQIRTTTYHEADFKIIDRDTDFMKKTVIDTDDLKCNGIKMDEDMKEFSLCVQGVKPHTDVWTFGLKDPDGLRLDTKTRLDPESKVVSKAEFSPPGGVYMGIYHCLYCSKIFPSGKAQNT